MRSINTTPIGEAIALSPQRPYVGVGAGSLDLYPPRLTEIPEGYIIGGKSTLTPEDMPRVHATAQLANTEQRVGGNEMNRLLRLALRYGVDTKFVGALGQDDIASEAIRRELSRSGVVNAAVTQEGYQPSISIVNRAPRVSRHIHGAPRTPIREALSEERLAKELSTAGAVGASSLNDMVLNHQVLEHTPEGLPLFFNFGGKEHSKFGLQLISALAGRDRQGKGRVTGVECNETEFFEIHGLTPPTEFTKRDHNRIYRMAETFTQSVGGVATSALITMDRAGFAIAHEGQVVHYEAAVVDDPEDTLGAGDAAGTAYRIGILQGKTPDEIADMIREATTSCISAVGGTGDLDHLRR